MINLVRQPSLLLLLVGRYPATRWIHSSLISKKDFKLTDIGEGIVQVEIMKWFVKPGDRVKEFDKLVEVQSDKATVEITSRFTGVVKSLAMEEGKMAKVGEVLVVFEDSPGDKNVVPPQQTPPPTPAKPATPVKTSESSSVSTSATAEVDPSDLIATPAVRHLAKENKINLSLIKGTGREGRILKSDVLVYLEQGHHHPPAMEEERAQQSEVTKEVEPRPPPRKRNTGSVTVIPITGIRREMGKGLFIT